MQKEAPLAARMRPRTLDEFLGQEHIVGPGRLLRRAIQADQLGSLIFYGPPGTGKTTLAQVIANTTRAHFIALNAVLSGVKEIRGAVEEAQQRAEHYSQRTILFIDEVHRFNKAQQDALLPWVENGTVIFIGATTENPYFEVNKALVSRSRIFQLTPLDEDDLRAIVRQALEDKERGYGNLHVTVDDDACPPWWTWRTAMPRRTQRSGTCRGDDRPRRPRPAAHDSRLLCHCRGVDPAPRRAL